MTKTISHLFAYCKTNYVWVYTYETFGAQKTQISMYNEGITTY